MKYDYSQETANEFLEQSDLDIEVLEAKIATQAAELERYEIARQEDAKRIDAQAATIAQLREALEPFAIEGRDWSIHVPDDFHPIYADTDEEPEDANTALFTVGDLRRAARALKGGE